MESGSAHEHESSLPRPPDGVRVVWAGKFIPVEGAPALLPGVIEQELPDGWALVSWADKNGWYSPEAVYETKDLRHVPDDEFDALVRTVRDSEWTGLVRQEVSEPEPSLYAIGDTVRWVGPVRGEADWDPLTSPQWLRDALGSVDGLTRHHPGTIVEIGHNASLRVRWVDKDGEYEGRAPINADFVEPVDEVEARRLTAQLRSSAWAGLRAD